MSIIDNMYQHLTGETEFLINQSIVGFQQLLKRFVVKGLFKTNIGMEKCAWCNKVLIKTYHYFHHEHQTHEKEKLHENDALKEKLLKKDGKIRKQSLINGKLQLKRHFDQ